MTHHSSQVRAGLEQLLSTARRRKEVAAKQLQEVQHAAGLDSGHARKADVPDDAEVIAAQLALTTHVAVATERALRRLAARVYGRCLECGLQISTARLFALPFASRCMECQVVAEAAASKDSLTI